MYFCAVSGVTGESVVHKYRPTRVKDKSRIAYKYSVIMEHRDSVKYRKEE
jgi:hypothetical protein